MLSSRSKKTLRILIVTAVFSQLYAISRAEAQIGTSFEELDSCRKSNIRADCLLERERSADELIESVGRLATRKRALCGRIAQALTKESAHGAASSAWLEYQEIFKEYQDALFAYNEHRKQYFEHCKQYHSPLSGESSSTYPSASVSSSGQVSSSEDEAFKKLEKAVGDKCKQLMSMETSLRNNESALQNLVEQLMLSQNKESPSILAGMWTRAESLAQANRLAAAQYNHVGIQKTSGASRAVHDLIMEANRDGAYNAHQKAFEDLSRTQSIQHEVYKRASKHQNNAMMMLEQLASLRPASIDQTNGILSGSATGNEYSAGRLKLENAALEKEYSNLQLVFQRLETAKKNLQSK